MRVKRFQRWEEVEQIRPAWDELLSDSEAQAIFLTWEWLCSWWATYGCSLDLYFLGCFDQDGRLIGLAPLYRIRWPLRLLGDGTGDSDGLDCIARRGRERAVVRAWLDWLNSHRSDWDILELNTVPAESVVLSILREELHNRAWRYWQRETPHLVVALPDSWESYLSSLSAAMRYSISRRIRDVEKQFRVHLQRCETVAELPRFLDQLFELHSQRWGAKGDKGAFHSRGRRKFFAEMSKQFLGRHWLDFWLLELNEQIVAAEFGFCYRHVYSYLQGGFDPSYSSRKAGLVLRALVLRELIRRGVRDYDFLGGDEHYKLRLGAQRRVYYNLRCARPGSRGAFYATVAVVLEADKRWARVWLPKPLWRSVRWIYLRLRPPSSLDEIVK